MAIDRTGISSLDAGALDIKYTGNEGPKSPKQMAGGEYNRVIELLEMVREGGPLSEEEKIELRELIKTLSASKQNEGIGNMAMKSGLIDDYRNYKSNRSNGK